MPSGGSINWSTGFLPAVYQGVAFRPGGSPIMHLGRPELGAAAEQRDSPDHVRTIYPHDGRSERPTVVYGEVVRDLLA